MIHLIGTVALLLSQSAPTVRLEAEAGRLEGPAVATRRSGFSGSGYVTNFVPNGARVVWRVPSKAGIYQVRIRFATPGGTKGFEVGVNGRRTSGQLPDVGDHFATYEVGKVELKQGDNEISVERGWGYYDLDYLELTPAKAVLPLRAVPARLSDPLASPAARRLFEQLRRDYGRVTYSGQYDDADTAFIRAKFGVLPAIYGADLIDYSPSRVEFGSKPQGTTEKWIRTAKAGQILTLSWHWNAPTGLLNKKFKNERGEEVDASWYKGFYTNATTFNIKAALANPDSPEYRLLLRDIDVIAIELKKLDQAGIPVLWRPLHEAEGGWFWWGAQGAEPCKRLYRLLFDRLTKKHGLHNLIWVWNSASADWYPGDDVVDIMSIDQYPSDRQDALSGPWEDLRRRFDGKKLLALAEFPGAPDVERMWRFGVRWSYFVSWTGDVGPRSTPPSVLLQTFRSKRVRVQRLSK